MMLPLVLSFLCFLCVVFSFQLPSFKTKSKTDITPIKKVEKQPVLKVNDPRTNSNIYLVGVSHGSPSSASLVKDMIIETKPAAVVLELCEDRFISICLEAEVVPYGNKTLTDKYYEALNKLKIRDDKMKTQLFKSDQPLAKLAATLQFITSQGLVGGFFVLVGFLGSGSQLLTSTTKTEDEFTTAIRIAKSMNIPIRLGDASQNETLKNIKNIISWELFNPVELFQGGKDLAFSFLGLFPSTSNKQLTSTIAPSLIQQSQWMNIPKAYSENPLLIKSMLPLLSLSFILILAEVFIDIQTSSVNAMETTLTTAAAAAAAVNTIDSSSSNANTAMSLTNMDSLNAIITYTATSLLSYFSSSTATTITTASEIATTTITTTATSTSTMSPLATSILSTIQSIDFDTIAIDILHLLETALLIRLSKLIGTNRDAILAYNIQETSTEFQGKKIVVVNGMLHSNGIARWILSGKRPSDVLSSTTRTTTSTTTTTG